MDHVSDIVPLLWAMRLDERTGPFEILAPDYVLSNVKVLIKRLETPEDFINYPLRLQPLQPGTHSEEIRVAPAAHAITTFAYRVNRDGRSFTYSADTAYSEAVVDLAKGCDLLVHEGTFPDEQADIAKLTTHSTGTQAGSVARLAKVKQLVLFHIPPPNEQYEAKIGEQAGRAFGGPTRVGQDLLEFNL
jgi:ribonuclease BN (tRNA processing enzyme)